MSAGPDAGHDAGPDAGPDAVPAGAPAVPAPAAYRAALVLEVLARRREATTLTEVAGALALPKSSVANVLLSLEAAGMVRRSPRGWLLGYKVLELGRSVLVSTELVEHFHRTASALPVLRPETTLLAVLEGTEVLYVARNDGQQPVRVVNEIGSRMPAVVTGLGRAMLSALDEDDLEARLAALQRSGPLPRPTDRSHRTFASLRADLARSRLRGHAVDEEQSVPGVVCLAVPVPGAATPTAVSATLIARRGTPELRAQVVAALRVLAARLGRLGSA